MTDKEHSTHTSVSVQVSISVVIPLYSGANYLTTLIAELDQVRNGWNRAGCPISLTEVILVDDAVIDRSAEIADFISRENDWITVIHLARNFGQHPATIAGILHTSGDWVVTLDEDLQHPPARIESLLRKAVLHGSDIVYANADTTVHESYIRDVSSRLYKRLMQLVTGNSNIPAFNSFRLIRGSVARAASSTCGHDTYFDISLSWFTQRIEVVRMNLKDERFIRSGKSGYTFFKLLTHARRMLMSSGARVMRSASLMGLIIIASSAIGAVLLVVHHLFDASFNLVKGWSSLMIATIFFGGTIIFLMGIILEYLALLVMNAHGKPIFFIIDRRCDGLLIDYFSGDNL
jgi:undecaprenyl-phosphate 4-deoxy-4-formamido-L-arabinose transferase